MRPHIDPDSPLTDERLDERPPGTAPPSWKWVRALLCLAALLIAALLFFNATEHKPPIKLSSERAELAVTTPTHRGAHRRVVEDEALRQRDTLSFSYTNPQGTHRSITVLAWDGQRLFWYAPRARGEPPKQIDPMRLTRSAVDFPLERHAPGPLWVAAAFDADPEALASALMAGGPIEGATTMRIQVTP